MQLSSSPEELANTTLTLPGGFQPAGIAKGSGATAYVGSRGNGAIYVVDLIAGHGSVLAGNHHTQTVLGLAHDPRTNYLYAAGGTMGNALVFDADSGVLVHEIQLTTDPAGLVLDVAATEAAAWFTDGCRPCLYRVALTKQGGVANPVNVEEVTLGGDFVFLKEDLNANGIVAVDDDQSLLVVHTALGALYRVGPATGYAAGIDLDGAVLRDSSGLAFADGTLYAANFNQCVYAIALDPTLSSGRVARRIISPHFDNPSALAVVGEHLYVVNARVATDAMPETSYWLTRIGRHDK